MVSTTSNTRNLPHHAGFAVAYGLPHGERPCASITYTPAKILGLERELGSLADRARSPTWSSPDGDLLEATHAGVRPC